MKTRYITLLALFVLFATVLQAQETATPEKNEQAPMEIAQPHTQPHSDRRGQRLPPPPPSDKKEQPACKAPHDAPHASGWHHDIDMRNFFQNLKKDNPEEYKRLMNLRMEDREKFFKEVFHAMPRPQRESEQRIAELDRKCWLLARKLHKTTDEAKKAEIKEELHKDAAETLDLLIAQTEEHIKEMQKRLKSFQENRDKILEKKVNFFLNLPPPPPKP